MSVDHLVASAGAAPRGARGRPGRPRGAAAADALLGVRRVVAREVLLCAGLLAALGVAVFGSHLVNGGFYNDDWAFSTTHRFREQPGVLGAIEAFSWMSFRPLATLYWPATHEVFGLNPGLHLGWVLAMAVAVSLSLYVLLRTLSFARLHAGVIASLVLVFPASDASRLWAAAGIALPAIALYLLGTTLALRALSASGRRSVLLHGVAVALYLASVMTYEIAAGAILVSVLLYRLRAGWRRAAGRWLADLLALLPLLVLVTSNTWNEPQPLRAQVEHAWTIAKQSTAILAGSALPFGEPRAVTVCGALAAVAAAGALVWRLLPPADPARAQLRRWLATAGASVLAIGAGYLTFVPAEPGAYSPLAQGQFNRVNGLAAIGYVMLVYSVAMVAGLVVFRGLPRWRVGSAAVALLASALLAAGYAGQVRADAALWDRSAAIQRDVVRGIVRAVPAPPPGAVIYTFGHPTVIEPHIPVFAATWDLSGAVKLRFGDPSLRGYPTGAGTTFVCGPDAMAPRNYNTAFDPQEAAYGQAYLVDVSRGRAARVTSAAECRSLTGRFLEGAA